MNLRRISDIHYTPVLDLETGEMLGQVVDWAVFPAQQKIAAYILSQPTLWRKAQVVVPADIIEYGPRMIVVRDSQSVIAADEIVGLPGSLQAKVNLLNFRAETESGKLLGTIADFTIEITGATIYQYYVNPPMLTGMIQGEWILPASKVIRIDQQRVIFPDSVLAGMKLAAQQQTQSI
jgi:uncharacterized protein YrrD